MSIDADRAARPRLFHGWIVVWAAFAVMLLGFGAAYSFTIFFGPLQEEFAASRGSLSLAFSIAGGLWFFLGALSGPLADRYGPRGTTLFGMAAAGLGLLIVSRAQALWQIYLGFGVCMGVGVGFSYVPAIGVVQRWFVRRRGFASGVAVSGIGVGTLAVPPLAALLLGAIGWRWAAALLGLIVILGGALAAWLLEDDPHRRGLAPDNDALDAAAPRPVLSGRTLPEALRSRAFIALFLAFMSASLGLFIPFVHLVPYAEDHGIAHRTAVLLVSGIGLGSTGGRFLLGGVADRIGRRLSFALMYLGMALMLLWWLVSGTGWQLAVFALVFGTCYGGFVALAPAVTVDYFGAKSAGAIIGALYASVGVGTFAGPLLAGIAFDLTQSYTLPILVSAVTMFLGLLLVGLMGKPPSR
ncbi:MAG TPA: MCT family MFS transporter [Stellaceae bacterium]|nr:MCT family MFS transporter [Stellaceae bacterium]